MHNEGKYGGGGGGGGLVSKSYLTLAIPWTVTFQAHCPWFSPGENTGVGCHFLLQEGNYKQGEKTAFRMGENNSK